MKVRTLQLLVLLAALAAQPFIAAAQRDGKPVVAPVVANKIKSSGLLAEKNEPQRKQIAVVVSKMLSVGAANLEVNQSLLNSLAPDLTITNVGPAHDPLRGVVYSAKVLNKSAVNAGACQLRFMYGMTLDADALESIDLSVPPLAAGKSISINFTPPEKKVHWWLFGVDVDNKLKEANFSNNLYVIEFETNP